MLEKTTNLTRTAYLSPPYDYDELVQRDRVHQLIYTDPGDLHRRDDACVRRGLGLSRA